MGINDKRDAQYNYKTTSPHYGEGEPHHQERIFDEIHRAKKTVTISIAIRQGFRLPDPIPNACPARRDVCMREAPKDENRSPWEKTLQPLLLFRYIKAHRFIKHKILGFNVVMNVCSYLEKLSTSSARTRRRCAPLVMSESWNGAHLDVDHSATRKRLQRVL